MSALSLISEYNSNSEESGSDEEDCANVLNPRIYLPSPNLSKVPIVPTETHIDNSELHGGRTRSFPHIRGNWASFVYIKYDANIIYDLVRKLKQVVNDNIKDCQECEKFHISLSKTFVLKYHLLSSFNSSLQKELTGIKRFDIGFTNIKIYSNEENTRTFIALELDVISQTLLLQISEQIDKVLTEFQLPTFYEDPSFHTSILWVVGDKKKELNNILEVLNDILNKELNRLPENISINSINCRTGNKYFQYTLC